eukprot:TRINITY_DN12187_c0_g1_i1.p1 TRINITY_DN12187_c0_g1~~TRINITY_DN12187_c0_g1_i1.p1  ORF type:complete len:357 (-),score=93.85 TRINITY_DN12187_c0_g1_i1:21-1091(-)
MSLASLLSLGRSKEEEKKPKPVAAEPPPAVAEDAKPRVSQNEEDRKLALELAAKQAEQLGEEMAMREAEEEADRQRSLAKAAQVAAELAQQKKKEQQAASSNPFSTGGRQFTPGVFVCDERSGHKPTGAISFMPQQNHPPPLDWPMGMPSAAAFAAAVQQAAAAAAAPAAAAPRSVAPVHGADAAWQSHNVPAAFAAAGSPGGSPPTLPQYRQGAMRISSNRSRSRSPPPSNSGGGWGCNGGGATPSQPGHSGCTPCSGIAGAPGQQGWSRPPEQQGWSRPAEQQGWSRPPMLPPDVGYGPPANHGGWAGYGPPGGYGAAPGLAVFASSEQEIIHVATDQANQFPRAFIIAPGAGV